VTVSFSSCYLWLQIRRSLVFLERRLQESKDANGSVKKPIVQFRAVVDVFHEQSEDTI